MKDARFIPYTGTVRVPQVLRADSATVMNHRRNAKHKSRFFSLIFFFFSFPSFVLGIDLSFYGVI